MDGPISDILMTPGSSYICLFIVVVYGGDRFPAPEDSRTDQWTMGWNRRQGLVIVAGNGG